MTPGRNPSVSTSARCARARTTARSSASLRSSAIDRLPRSSSDVSPSAPIRPPRPPFRSIRTTAAPRSARSIPQKGPGPSPANSTTRTPASGPAASRCPPTYAPPLPRLVCVRPLCRACCRTPARRGQGGRKPLLWLTATLVLGVGAAAAAYAAARGLRPCASRESASGASLSGPADPRSRSAHRAVRRRRTRISRVSGSMGGSGGAPVGADSPVVVVANRLPVDQVTDPDGSVRWQRSPGGLVTALEPFVAGRGGAWVGWSGSAGEAPEPFESGGMSLIPVELSEDEVDRYYEGMSNASLWPLYHDVVEKPEYHRAWWDTYVQVNRRFAERAAEVAAEGAIVWVHDYQLQLVPAMLRQQRPDLTIGFFLHIPFPPYELFTQLPWRQAIIEGLLGADLVGFQRPAAATNFVQLARRLHELPTRGGVIEYDGRAVAARAFPISIDARSFDELASSPEVLARAKEIRAELGDPRRIVLGVDRLDYTKGISVRLNAFQELLEDEAVEAPETVLVQVATPSRERVEHYVHMRETIEQQVGHINGVFGSIAGPAVHYFNQSMPREELAALYRAADVMLVTPYRDGMNLVAKEYVAARGDLGGALVLSEFAGAAAELKQAYLVNPHDIAGVKAQLVRALRQEPAEAARRMRAMRRHLFRNDLEHWATSFFDALRAQAEGRAEARE